MTRIDIVTAVRSEERTLPLFVRGVRALHLPDDVEIGMLFVEDSSEDATRSLLRGLAEQDPLLRYYSLEHGFGQGPAIVFGLSRSAADAVIMMDVDGSHPLHVIPEMIEHFLGGARVVQCHRRSIGGRPGYRTIGSAAFRAGARMLTGVDVETQNIYYRLVASEFLPALVDEPRYWSLLRFPLPPRSPDGLVVLEIDTEERLHGETKYGPMRLTRLAADGVLSLIPDARFAFISMIAGAAALALLGSGAWLAGSAMLLVILWTLRRFTVLRSSDVLNRMRVTESSESGRDRRDE